MNNTTYKNFSDLPVTTKGSIRKVDLWTFILEIATWTFVIFMTGFLIIFQPDELSKSMPYIVLGMMLASTFWYLRIRTLYMKLHQEKLLSEIRYEEIRKRQIELDKKEKEFIAMTSHQLNTPLSVVRNASAELMRQMNAKTKKYTEKEHRYLLTINDASKRMVTYLNDLISLIRSDTSILELSLKSINVKNLLEKIISDFKIKAEDKNMSLKLAIEKNTDEVICDVERISMALSNLIDNAITYGQFNSNIQIKAQNSDNYIQFSIQNEGIGIPRGEQSHIFQRFYRASNSRQTNKFGTGLGLSITRDIIVQQGGTIWFESVSDEKTTFYFTLPKV